MGSIEIPEPVFEMFSTQTSTPPLYVDIYDVEIKVGEVVLFERRYSDNEEHDGSVIYARNLEEAEEQALNAFGEKLKEFLK